ncbi:SDR family NAD(P)-dependent oxidoreductase [Pedobacter kyonggii]|uniref:Glucose 1-dehydrogenase n=1 Tax=Pedobacter kyonggii TaxID=1926871 RepID=A0A4Q9H9F8_9SPHI|nr:glucose 1-dehydrogenase [Pedobacter kyonggii]TBO40605.1 glucose 1-dehydrogenase [Pedobacter kyonggii]
MGSLENKVAVITGATSGMALAIAKLFVSEGAYVYITGRNQEKLDEAVKAIGNNVRGIQGDAANLKDLDRLFDIIESEQGKIDILYANAGVGDFGPLGMITEEHFDKLFNLNVKAVVFAVQKALPLFNNGGSIIMTGSIAAMKGFAGLGLYGASKAALRSLARTWTNELKEQNIRVNVINPGPIDSDFFNSGPKEAQDFLISLVPMGRKGQPQEIASAALFLASDASSFITGIELSVDGGLAQV